MAQSHISYTSSGESFGPYGDDLFDGDLSIAICFYTTNSIANGAGLLSMWLDDGDDQCPAINILRGESINTAYMEIADSGGTTHATDEFTLSHSQWYPVVVTSQADGDHKVYASSSGNLQETVPGVDRQELGDWKIGFGIWQGVNAPTSYSVAHMAIWTGILSADDVVSYCRDKIHPLQIRRDILKHYSPLWGTTGVSRPSWTECMLTGIQLGSDPPFTFSEPTSEALSYWGWPSEWHMPWEQGFTGVGPMAYRQLQNIGAL